MHKNRTVAFSADRSSPQGAVKKVNNIHRGCEKIVQNGRKPPSSKATRVIP